MNKRMSSPSEMVPTKIFEQKYTNFHFTEDFIGDSQILKYSLDSNKDDLDVIKSAYFNSDREFDSNRFELLQIPKLFKLDDIAVHSDDLIQQHHIVSKKLLLLILQNQFKCKVELENILKIQKTLANIIKVCKRCRTYLNLATTEFTTSSLQILHYYRKRKMLKNLLLILYKIKTLYGTKDKLQQLLNQENYPKVISLISECQKAAETYKQYYCVVALSNNMNDVLEQVEENLDLSLSKICVAFNADNYASIHIAYNFLSKSETAIDQLHMHFTAAVHNTAVNCISKYSEDSKKEQYNDLCTSIPSSNFFYCLMELCRNLLKILKSYYLIYKWHVNYNITENIQNDQITANYPNDYIIQKLQSGIVKIFYDIESKILVYFDEFNFSSLKYEDFIKILSVMGRIFKIANDLCSKNMSKLYECLKRKFLSYFTFYHASRLDELRIFLENDGWDLCPIKTKFHYTQMLEFKTLKFLFNLCESKESIVKQIVEDSICKRNDSSENFLDDILSPFDTTFVESTEEDILRETKHNQLDLSDDSEDEIPEELKHDFVDEHLEDTVLIQIKKHTGPILTNTTLSVLRICGKYLQIIPLLKEVTKTVVQYLTQLFELYFYAVYHFFASDFIMSDYNTIHTTNIKRIISRIKEKLVQDSDVSIDDVQYHKVRQPHLSSLDLSDSTKLYCLTERIVATESLIFLGHQYDSFQLYFDCYLSSDEELMYLIQFYRQIISSTTSLRKPVYMAAISKTFDVSNILILMSKVNWELKDVMSQHSDYIEYLIQEIQSFATKFSVIQKLVPLCKEAYESIWESVSHLITHTLVEGFSNAKKCSNGGRALMQLDFTQFVSKFEEISQLRPMPHQEYVASYIKAYYLPESSIELWIKKHSEYSSKQLIGLLSCMFQSRKVKQRLVSLIEDNRLNR